MNITTDLQTFNSNINLPNTSTPLHNAQRPSPLHKALIEYATDSCRLLFIQDASAWENFNFASINSSEHNDLTTSELCAIFIKEVLPNVSSYQLAEPIKRRLKLLNVNPRFRAMNGGYQHIPTNKMEFAENFVLQPKQDFSLADHITQSQLPSLEESMDVNKSAEISHTVLVDANDSHRRPCGYKFQFSSEIGTFLSAIVSTDLEISSSKLHEPEEIHRRLRNAKKSFEATGKISFFRNDLQSIQNNVETFLKLKQKLCESISRRNF